MQEIVRSRSAEESAAYVTDPRDKHAGKFMNTGDVAMVVTVLANFQIQHALDLYDV